MLDELRHTHFFEQFVFHLVVLLSESLFKNIRHKIGLIAELRVWLKAEFESGVGCLHQFAKLRS